MRAPQYGRDMAIDAEKGMPLPTRHLTDGWRTVAFINWVFVAAATIAIAITSRTIGRPVWWLGTESNPGSPFLLLLPAVVFIVPLVASVRLPQRIVVASCASSALLIISAAFDISSTPAIALGLGIVGAASLAVSIALFAVARQYR